MSKLKKMYKILSTVGNANYYAIYTMSKVENFYKPRLKTILKQHHFYVNRAQMNKYSCTQILISVHMDRFAFMQNLHICKLKFALDLNQVQISRICIWCKFCIRVQIKNQKQVPLRAMKTFMRKKMGYTT